MINNVRNKFLKSQLVLFTDPSEIRTINTMMKLTNV